MAIPDVTAAMSSRRRRARFGASVLDQGLASISNLLMSVAIASQVPLIEFGAFGLVFALFILVQGSARAFVGEALLIRNEVIDGRVLSSEARAVASCAIVIGLTGSAVSVVASIPATGVLSQALLALAVVFPFLIWQDLSRYISFSAARPRDALYADALWFGAQVLTYIALLYEDVTTVVPYILFWGLSSVVSVLYQMRVVGSIPGFGLANSWVKIHKDLSPRFLGEYLTLAAVQQGTVFIVGAVAGLSAVGGLRSAQVLLGPVNVISLGAAVVILPAIARIARSGNVGHLRKYAFVVSCSLSSVTLVYSLLLMLVPDKVGQSLLSDSWGSGQQIAPLLALSVLLNNVSYGATSAIRGMERAKQSLRMRLVTGPISIAAVATGAVLDGAVGAVLGLAAASAIQVLLWWTLFLHLSKKEVERVDGNESGGQTMNRAGTIWPGSSSRFRARQFGLWGCVIALVCAVGAAITQIPLIIIGIAGVFASFVFALRNPKGFVCVTVVVLLFVRTIEQRSGIGASGYLDEFCVIIGLVAFPVARYMNRQRLVAFPGSSFFAVFLLFGILSSYINLVPMSITLSGILLAGKGIAFGWSVAQVDWTESDIPRVVKISCCVMAFVLGCALINLLFPGFWVNTVMQSSGFGRRYGVPPIIGPFVHPGYFGTTVALFAIGTYAYRLKVGKSRLNTILLLSSSAASFLTFRRKVLGALMVCIAYLYLRTRGPAGLSVLLMVLPALLVICWPFFVAVAETTSTEYLSNPGGVARIRLYIDGFGIAIDRFPFGSGFGRFGSATARAYYSPEYEGLGYRNVWGLGADTENGRFLTDTFWPSVFGEAGFVGGAGFIGGLWIFFQSCRQNSRSASTPLLSWLYIVGAAWSIELSIESLAGAVFTAAPTYGLFFGLVGFIAGVKRSDSAGNGSASETLRSARP
ncbi:hypothetical protein HQO44_12240 [Rhodococcus fascians]|nr:hypothetical protein [Rhodococcus fascians]